MKKLMIACAAALVGISAAQAADVTSANVVGFQQITLKPTWNMVAANWETTGNGEAIPLQDFIPGNTEGLTGATAIGSADSIKVYDSTSTQYTDYYLYYNARQPNNARNYKWVTASGVVTDMAFTNGAAFWFYSRSNSDVTITLKGQVDASATQSIGLVPGYNMIGSAFPANFNPNALGTAFWQTAIANGAVGATAIGSADTIKVYNSADGNYTDYYLYYNARQPNNARNYKWVTASGTEVDANAEFIPSGKGVWYYHRGNGYTLMAPTPVQAE